DDYDSDAKLLNIIADPTKFKCSIILLLVEHAAIIALAVTLFVAFGSYNVPLGIVWIIFRTGDGLVQFYSEISYWRLLGLARQYQVADDNERRALGASGRLILAKKNTRFTLAMVLFGIGTLAYSSVCVTYGLVPFIIGWMGIIIGALDVAGSGIRLAKPKFVALAYIGGLLTLIFEAVIGGWLLFE
ncbi:MAG: DUF4386 family protein, partial [Arenicellales bacterium]|nr:DUF4386 family protein [Arenicellales bacterium]